MSFMHVDVPASKSSKAPRFSAEELAEVHDLLVAGNTPSDGEVYSEMVNKRAPRDVAYYHGWYLRNALCEEYGMSPKTMMVKTWADGEGFRWALKLKK